MMQSQSFLRQVNLICFRLFEMCKINHSTMAVVHHERTAALDLDFAYNDVSYICFALPSQQIVSFRLLCWLRESDVL